MGSGAFSVFIDQQAGGGSGGAQQRVVPIPPPEQSGGVKFTTVAFSLAYDTFGQANAPATIPAVVRVLHGSGAVDTIDVTVELGASGSTSCTLTSKQYRSNCLRKAIGPRVFVLK